jgi:hypothetical protein
MSQSTYRVCSAALVFCALFCGALPLAIAQRAVPVENIDEPGRSPYLEARSFVQNADACPPNYCFVRFAPVPAGKRLVVTHVAVRFFVAVTFGVPYLELGPDVVQSSTTLPLPTATVPSTGASTGDPVAVMSAPVTWYAEAGTTPTLLLIGPNAFLRFSLPSLATISGYFVNLR